MASDVDCRLFLVVAFGGDSSCYQFPYSIFVWLERFFAHAVRRASIIPCAMTVSSNS